MIVVFKESAPNPACGRQALKGLKKRDDRN